MKFNRIKCMCHHNHFNLSSYQTIIKKIKKFPQGLNWTLINEKSLWQSFFLYLLCFLMMHDDVIKWKHFPHYWPFVHQWIPHTKASKAELWCFLWSAPWINGWVNKHDPGDLRHHSTHYDVIVMDYQHTEIWRKWLSLCRWHIPEWKPFSFYSNFAKVCANVCSWQCISSLVLIMAWYCRWQTITCANNYPVHWNICSSPSLNILRKFIKTFIKKFYQRQEKQPLNFSECWPNIEFVSKIPHWAQPPDCSSVTDGPCNCHMSVRVSIE